LLIAVRNNDAKLPRLSWCRRCRTIDFWKLPKSAQTKDIFSLICARKYNWHTPGGGFDPVSAERPMTVERFMRGLAKGRVCTAFQRNNGCHYR
jgi:hypothetical protein